MSATTPAEPPLRGLSYARASRDPHKIRASTTAQHANNRDHARRKGIEIVAEYEDDAITGAKAGVRPDFTQLVTDIRGRRGDVVVTWEKERLHRTLTDFETITVAAAEAGVRFLIDGRWFDPADVDEWVLHGMGALLGAGEVKRFRRRLVSRMADFAKAGRPHGKVPYGRRRIWEVDEHGNKRFVAELVEPEQAAVIREVARRLLAGEGELRICRDLTRRGVRPPHVGYWGPSKVRALLADDPASEVADRVRAELDSGHSVEQVAKMFRAEGLPLPPRLVSEWEPSKLRQVMTRAHLAGDRVYRGEVVATDVYPPILDRGDVEALRVLLDDPARRGLVTAAQRHMYSGIALCGVCLQGVRAGAAARSTREGNRWLPIYCCAKGHVSRRMDLVDRYVTARMLALMESPEYAAALAARRSTQPAVQELRDEVADLRRRLDEAADACADRQIDQRQLTRITAKLKPQLAAAQKRLDESARGHVLDGLVGPDARATWEAMTLDQRRTAVGAALVVKIMPRESRRWSTIDDLSVTVEPL